jgi:ABC-type phosphate transport system substrate-binding protein
MKSNALTILVSLMIASLVVSTAQTVNAQEFRKEIMKGIFQTIGPDVFKDVAKSMAAELTKNEEFRNQLIQQVIREVVTAIGPENMKDIVKSVAAEVANANEVKVQKAVAPANAMDADSVRAALLSVAGEFTKDPAVMNAITSGGPVTSPQALAAVLKERMAALGRVKTGPSPQAIPASRNFRNDLIAVITHPSNPVDTLTVDQVRKLFNGEYTNWSQVGGQYLPVRLIASRDTPAALESLLDTHLAPSAARVPLLSFLFVGVAENEGALGFLPTHNVEQLEFVRGHGAIKKIAIKKDEQSPALSPNPGAAIVGSYPLLAGDTN